MHRIVGVKKEGFIGNRQKSVKGIQGQNQNQKTNKGLAEAKSREHEQGGKPGNPIHIKHQEELKP